MNTFLALLDAFRAPVSELADETRPLARLVAFIRPRRREPAEQAVIRFRELVRMLRAHPDAASALRLHLARLLGSRMHRLLYAESGILTTESFRTAFLTRLFGRLLPAAPDGEFLRDLLAEIFESGDDHTWLEQIPEDDWLAFFEALGIDDEQFAPARRQCMTEAMEALRMVSLRLAASGMDAALLRYQPALARHESPFTAQAQEVADIVATLRAGHCAAQADMLTHLDVLLGQCRACIEAIRRKSREAGVSVGLVYLLARIEQMCARVHVLASLVAGCDALEQRRRALNFLLRVLREEDRRHSLRDLGRATSELLARRVTEQASRTGEHYVSDSRSEFFGIFRAAAGAGLIVGFMALLKIFIGKLGLPLAWQALGYSLNYGLGFVLVHLLHFTIATKQPAMTAATLAAALDGRASHADRLDALSDLAAKVSRTQWISILGNVSVGFLCALAISLIGSALLQQQPVDAAKAEHLLHDLHPWYSLALPHAAIAGVYLFLSGLISGYYDNQALYHRVPDRLRRLRWLRALVGERRSAALADYVEHNLGALAGNFLFGCMLGSTGVIGELLGLPLDIRHVAFGSANLAFGLAALQFALPWSDIAVLTAGVLLVGLTNLAVSFTLAMKVALKSRGIGPEHTRGLSAHLLHRFLRRPRDFFWPPAEAAPDKPPVSP